MARDLDRLFRHLAEWLSGDTEGAHWFRLVLLLLFALPYVWWFWRLDRRLAAIQRHLGIRAHAFWGAEEPLVSKPSSTDRSAPQQVATRTTDSP
jgi:hypothetical protein